MAEHEKKSQIGFWTVMYDCIDIRLVRWKEKLHTFLCIDKANGKFVKFDAERVQTKTRKWKKVYFDFCENREKQPQRQ